MVSEVECHDEELEVPDGVEVNGQALARADPRGLRSRHGRDGQPLPGELLLRHLVGRHHSSSRHSDQAPRTWGPSFSALKQNTNPSLTARALTIEEGGSDFVLPPALPHSNTGDVTGQPLHTLCHWFPPQFKYLILYYLTTWAFW